MPRIPLARRESLWLEVQLDDEVKKLFKPKQKVASSAVQVPTTPHTLVITNDFPPQAGGIQTLVYEFVRRFDPATVSVLTSSHEGDAQFDALQAFRVQRCATSVLLPTRKTLRQAREMIEATGATQVIFGAMAPLGLLAPALRKLGITTIVAMSMGHEAGWAMTPILRQALRRIANAVDTVTYLTEYTRSKIAPALSSAAASAMVHLPPGVDTERFHPSARVRAQTLRAELGLTDAKVIVCVSRLMKRKGQDALIEAMASVRRSVPDAHLVIVGKGSYGPALAALVNKHRAQDYIHLVGEVPYGDLAAWYAVGDIFAMPCRTRNGGWDVEGLGIVFLEASALELPVVAGDSGGAPDAVREGITGYVVNGRNIENLSHKLVFLLEHPQDARKMGEAGREWVLREWTWDHSYDRLRTLI